MRKEKRFKQMERHIMFMNWLNAVNVSAPHKLICIPTEVSI